MKPFKLVLSAWVLFLLVGCSTNELDADANALKEDISTLDRKPQVAIWADCEAYRTVGTNTNFKPTAGNFDELYTGGNFPNGLGAISESKPGDQDYNGGRWHVNSLKEGVDPDKYVDACSVEDLDLEDFESSEVYFECPLIPANN